MIVDEGLSKLEEDSKKDCSSIFFETSNFSSLLSLSDFYDLYIDFMFFMHTLISVCQDPVITYPGQDGWIRAKFRFRSSLFTLVTLVDHLCLESSWEMGCRVRFVCLNMKQTYHILKWFYWEIVTIVNLIHDNNNYRWTKEWWYFDYNKTNDDDYKKREKQKNKNMWQEGDIPWQSSRLRFYVFGATLSWGWVFPVEMMEVVIVS